jgi:hypothetical protein
MSNAEIITWQLGVERSHLYGGIVGFLSLPRRLQDVQMTPEQVAARAGLSTDGWRHWVARGFDDGRAASDDVPSL